MKAKTNRRDFLRSGTVAAGGLIAAGTEVSHATEEPHKHKHDDGEEYPRDRPSAGGPVGSPTDRGKLVPGRRGGDEPPLPVATPDLDKLFWEMKDGVKEFHLFARHSRREFLPGLFMDVWGYNDSMPGPTIEANEGDRVRIILHNELPEPTTLHLHGLELPIAMDGVSGVTQDPIMPGESFAYELDLHQNGTFFYHSHGAMQEALGMVGLFIIHPRAAHAPPVDHDFGLILQEWAVLPGASIPNTLSMEFNFFTINGRSAPYMTPIVVRLGDRVRIRMVNFSVIDHHPMHLHGVTFWVTGNEGGRIPESAWVPGNNVIVGVAQAREIEFIANNPGDWVMHCHMFHHMMNHMTSPVGMMGAHNRKGTPAGLGMAGSMGMLGRGPALSEDYGPALGRGLGEQTGNDRAARNGAKMEDKNSGHGKPVAPAAKDKVPHGGHEGMDMKGDNKPAAAKSSVAKEGHEGMDMGGKGMKEMSMPGMKRNDKDSGSMPGMDMGEGAKSGALVPGFPQDMNMGMYSKEELGQLNRPETRGMRADWYRDVAGLMTVVRILPADLYDKVVSGEGDVEPGASVPDAAPGKGHEKHQH